MCDIKKRRRKNVNKKERTTKIMAGKDTKTHGKVPDLGVIALVISVLFVWRIIQFF